MVIETDEQRRWWFATHPQFSGGSKGIRGSGQRDRKEATGKVRPEDVDAYVDEALKYERGPVAELLKSVKRNFGTEAQLAEVDQQQSSGLPASRKDSYDKYEDALSRMDPNELAYQENIEQSRKLYGQGLISDPHTAMDLIPIGRLLSGGMQGFKSLLKSLTRGAILSAVKGGGRRWKVGDDPLAPTSKGTEPSYTTQYKRYWKNEAAKEDAIEKRGAENVERMKKGTAEQRINLDTGELESKELHHTPTPRRQGGKGVREVWPDEHAAIDYYRRLKKR